MNTYAIYSLGSGLLTGGTIQCTGSYLDSNVPDGYGCILGQFDCLSQQVDLASGAVIDYQPPQPSADHAWNPGTKRWEYVEPLLSLQGKAIQSAFVDVDAVVRDAVGNRSKEYADAEADARAFAAAGYAGTAPESVSSYAQNNSTGAVQTDEWAAQNIIARANAFEWAQLQMRTNRFKQQGLMRAAATLTDLDAAVVTWNGFIAQLRAQLGL